MITVPEALKNIDMVVATTNMNREQHNILAESVKLVAERCQLAEKLEAQLKAEKEAGKKPENK